MEKAVLTGLRITGVQGRDRWLDTERNSQGVKQRGTETEDVQRVSVAVWSVGSSVQVSWAVGAQAQLTSPTWGNGERTQQ